VGLPADALMHLQNGTLDTRYKGRRLLKSPFDLALYTRLLAELRPAAIIEIGTLEGGSALWFRDQCRAIGLADTRILTIDLKPPEMVEEGIELFAGNSLDPDSSFPGGLLAQLPHPWLVVEDSAHSFASVSAVLSYFDPLLASGDVIVVEDGVVADLSEPEYSQFEDGPNHAVADFLAHGGARYRIRTDLCDFYGPNLTWAPNGWLQKV
jgi:cephalosporin hydroxylase